jgi:hypothetical protein
MNQSLKVLHTYDQSKTSSTSSQFSVQAESFELGFEMFEI